MVQYAASEMVNARGLPYSWMGCTLAQVMGCWQLYVHC